MISGYAWYLRELLKKVWLRVASFAFLALLAAAMARVLAPYMSPEFAVQTGSEAIESLLGILTSSMLAVTTFSLSIAVSAFAAAAGSATPRATVLLQQDHTTQNVLATFLGAFVFGLVGLIALHAKVYDTSGKVIVFFFTIAVIGLVVVALIRWIEHLMQFGRMGDTLDRVERAASRALCDRLNNPWLGGQPLSGAAPADAISITAEKTGYVQHIDMQAMQECAEKVDATVFLDCLPGAFVAAGEPLLFIHPCPDTEKTTNALRHAVIIGTRRTFDDDPRFGLIVLTEIASRALSPSVNDPGTAIDIIGRLVRIISQWHQPNDPIARFDRVHIASIALTDIMEDTFRPIARDGAALSEVQIRLQKALISLADGAPDVFGEVCADASREALKRAEAAQLLPSELQRLRRLATHWPT